MDSQLEESAREQKLAELEILRQALESKEKEAQDYKDKWMRSRAEMENFRKRTEKERAETLNSLLVLALGSFLPVLEQMERAVDSLAAAGHSDSKIKEGFTLVLNNMTKIFESHGLSKVAAAPGERYDPARHEVVATEESADGDGIILRVEQAGYRIGDRVLRPAKVVVSKKSAE
ncbi:MAG: nucleotide exchange factor GrpE [Elusimicrobia bacterium]|nr:nucleotide exchange factor GrpE [Elusimicrobiota bacterium]